MENIHRLMEAYHRMRKGEEISSVKKISADGSQREYYRFCHQNTSCLGVFNENIKENISYLDYSRQLEMQGLTVPAVYYKDSDERMYFVEDLGEQTLFLHLGEYDLQKNFPDTLRQLYKKIIEDLLLFQRQAGAVFDYSKAFSGIEFDRNSMYRDLLYFKYYFLNLAKIPFSESALEDDFSKLLDFAQTASRDFFMFRDFQSRNIMLRDNTPYYIDFQGGRKGPLAYDLASLLYDAKANLPNHIREDLLEYYIDCSKAYPDFKEKEFRKYFYIFVCLRIMQAMGAYGLRGLFEKKSLFLKSIPYAIRNINQLINENRIPLEMPEWISIFKYLKDSPWSVFTEELPPSSLCIRIHSFSFKKGPSPDLSGNGGGFIFDCRGLPNPGRQKEYLQQSGKDEEVIRYLSSFTVVNEFISNAIQSTKISIENYIQRGFENLRVDFGCTGGQHRSVYCAENYAKQIRLLYPSVKIELRHDQGWK